ncbi:MAG: XRE family transcriptional regulator [Bacteroidetes bacterium HGW-Bacteroidetes-13]|nr:MAG: XRE family transcriptional regulator [Bacteroidetes bacterium HGW-Bacteroidetes-13]
MRQSSNHSLNSVIAQKIKHLRKQKNVTLEAFYFDTGIHLARIEQGKMNITVSTLERICSYFDTNLSDFFSDIDKFMPS